MITVGEILELKRSSTPGVVLTRLTILGKLHGNMYACLRTIEIPQDIAEKNMCSPRTDLIMGITDVMYEGSKYFLLGRTPMGSAILGEFLTTSETDWERLKESDGPAHWCLLQKFTGGFAFYMKGTGEDERIYIIAESEEFGASQGEKNTWIDTANMGSVVIISGKLVVLIPVQGGTTGRCVMSLEEAEYAKKLLPQLVISDRVGGILRAAKLVEKGK